MMHFEGVHGLVLMLEAPPHDHPLWTRGINTSSSVRTMRILMPTGLAINILDNADIEIFANEAGAVEYWPSALPDLPVYFLKSESPGVAPAMTVRDIQTGIEFPKKQCKTLLILMKMQKQM